MLERLRIVLPPLRGEIVPHYEEGRTLAHAWRLGMWAFIASEILMFSGLFLAFVYYRWAYPVTFSKAARALGVGHASLSIVLLATGSLLLAFAELSSLRDRWRSASFAMGVTALLGLGVLATELVGWMGHLKNGLGPGRFFTSEDVHGPGASLFFSLYYIFGGLHLLHVLVGACILLWLTAVIMRGKRKTPPYLPLQMMALYWNFTLVVGLVAYPLFHLS